MFCGLLNQLASADLQISDPEKKRRYFLVVGYYPACACAARGNVIVLVT